VNWEALAFWAAIAVLVGLVGYLELGWTIARRRAKASHPSTFVDPATRVEDVNVVAVRCAECGQLIKYGVNVTTGDRVQHISLGEIVQAIGTHRARQHRASA
jgi:hypothetical protein